MPKMIFWKQKSYIKKIYKSQDVVIGLAASGNTPFTCKVMEEVKKGALTIV